MRDITEESKWKIYTIDAFEIVSFTDVFRHTTIKNPQPEETDSFSADRRWKNGKQAPNTEPDDFTGTWTSSSTYNLCAENLFVENLFVADYNVEADIMAWDPVRRRLYIVPVETGLTLEYDPLEDRWRELDRRPIFEVVPPIE